MMRFSDRFSWHHRAAALLVVAALAVPSTLRAAPPDQLRADQPRGTAVGLEELPRALGRALEAPPASGPSTALGTGLEEDWRETLGRLPAAGRFRSLPERESVSIPLQAFKVLPQELLLVHLADEHHIVLVQLTSAGLKVSAKGILAVPRTLKLGQPLLVGRTPADEGSDHRLVLPDQDPWKVVSGTHLRIELTQAVGGEPVLALTHLSTTNGTYLSAEQVDALRRSPAAGLEETEEPLRVMVVTDRMETLPGVQAAVHHWRDEFAAMPSPTVWFDMVQPSFVTTLSSEAPPPDLILVDADNLADHGKLGLIDQMLQRSRFAHALSFVTDLAIVDNALRDTIRPLMDAVVAHREGGRFPSPEAPVVAFWRSFHDRQPSLWQGFARSELGIPLGEIPIGAYYVNLTGVSATDRGPALEFSLVKRRDRNLTAGELTSFRQYTIQLIDTLQPKRLAPTKRLHAKAREILATRFFLREELGLTDFSALKDGTRFRLRITGPGLEPQAGGLEEGSGEEMRILLYAMVGRSLSVRSAAEHFTDIFAAWGRTFPSKTGIVGTATVVGPETVKGQKPLAPGRPADLALFLAIPGPDTNPEELAAIAEEVAAFDRLPRAQEAPLVVIGVAKDQTTGWQVVQMPEGPHHARITQMVLPDLSPAWGDRLQVVLTRLASDVLDRRRAGLPKGQIFNPKTPEFAILVAGLLDPHSDASRDLMLSILQDPMRPLTRVEPELVGRLATALTNGDSRDSTVWDLEEIVRTQVLARDPHAMADLWNSVETLRQLERGGPAFLQAHPRVLEELHQLQARAELDKLLRSVMDQQDFFWERATATPREPDRFGVAVASSQQHYLLKMFFIEQDQKPEMIMSLGSIGGAALGVWEQQVIQRFRVRMEYRPPAGEDIGIETVMKLSGKSMGIVFKLDALGLVNLDAVHSALAQGHLRLHVEGPGLQAETGLEEATVEQTTRTQADPTLDQYY